MAMWPITPAWLATAMGLAFVIPFLVNFSYDWLVASAVVDPTAPGHQRLLARWQRWAYGPVALGMRLLTAGALVVMIGQGLTHWEALRAGLAAAGVPDEIAFILVGMGLLLTPLLALGVAPRLTAVLLYFPVGFSLLAGSSFWPGLVAMYGLTAVILLGPGPLALWQPEARAFTQRLGS